MNIYYEQFSHLESNQHFLNRYLKLIDKFKERNLKKSKGLHNHHIFPKSFGGSNRKFNMVFCSPKEHFILHHLLWKAFPNSKMVYAFNMMVNHKKCKITARVYEQLKMNFTLHNKNKKMAWINNGIVNKMIKLEFIKEFIDLGWFRGTLPHSSEQNLKQSKSTLGKIWINDGFNEKNINSELFQEFIELGWLSGRLPNFGKLQSENKKGTICINNGVCNKYIKPELLQDFLNNGWFSGKTTDSINRHTNSIIGRIKINNGEIEKNIKPEFLQEHLYLGWVSGGLPKSEEFKLQSSLLRKGKKYFNNGQIELLIGLEQSQEYLNLGWVNKRLYKTIREQNISR